MRGKKLGKDLLKSIKRDDLVGFLAEKTSMWGGKDIRNDKVDKVHIMV